MILRRYLNKEIGIALIAVTAVLLAIFMSNQLVRYLSYAADGRLEVVSILKLMVLEVPHLLGVLLPLGLYLAILLVFGRLYIDQEMTIMGACGISRGQIIKMIMPLISGVLIVVTILSLAINPWVLNFRNQLLEQTGSATTLKTLLPGRFQELSGGERIVYAGSISSSRRQLHDLFMAEQNKEHNIAHWDILVAAEGYQEYNKKTKEQFVVTTNSYRYIGIPGQNDFQVVHYGRYGVRVQNKRTVALSDEDALPTFSLLRTALKLPRHMAELQWRISLPIMVFVLGLLAVPLSELKRGQGKYARFLPAILIYIIYANLLIVSRSWISRGMIHSYLGMWWLHLVMLLGISIYYSHRLLWGRFKLILGLNQFKTSHGDKSQNKPS